MDGFVNTIEIIFFDTQRVPFALFAVALTGIVGVVCGPFMGNVYPLFWNILNLLFGRLGDKMDRINRPKADLMFRGFMMTCGVLFAVLFFYQILGRMDFEEELVMWSQGLVLCALMTSGSVWYAMLQLYSAQEGASKTSGAYFNIARSTRVNLAMTDDYGIARQTISMGIRAFDRGMVTPVFWYIVGGLPFALLYNVLAFLAWRYGKDGFSKGFSALPMMLERIMGVVPGVLSAVLITVAGIFTPTTKKLQGVSMWLHFKNYAPYAQGGLPLSAASWLLNISLGGPVQDLSGSGLKNAWVGPPKATAQNDHRHLKRAIYLNIVSSLLLLLALCGLYILREL